jgi:hypothetical protein
MARYLVSAGPQDNLEELQRRLEDGEIELLEPFGRSLHHSLANARLQKDGRAVWEELDYCSPPLAQERAAVLDDYFEDIEVIPVERNEGWKQIADLPSLWSTLGKEET